jgi:ABC-type multidrug transport system ATPase subunit
MREVIDTQNLTKLYKNGVRAFKGLNLKIYENEIFIILGPNGAGKTTLLYIISTKLKPTEGSVSIMGYDSTKDLGKVRGAQALLLLKLRSLILLYTRLYGLTEEFTVFQRTN